MKERLLSILRCPVCRAALNLSQARGSGGEVQEGSLVCVSCRRIHPIRKGIPRFVCGEQYAASFGLEWKTFSKTQLDSANGTSLSADKFKSICRTDPACLKGSLVLEAGCGMGRFVEVAACWGAEVIGMDLSAAVDAASENVGRLPNVHLVQGDLYHPPFAEETFDWIYSIGVLHHTPSTREAVERLVPYLGPGGRFVAWIYHRYWEGRQWPPFALFYRKFTKHLPKPLLLAWVRTWVPLLLPLVRLPVMGRYLKWPIPVVDYQGLLSLRQEQLREWSVLDTFDLLSPQYAWYHTSEEVRSWGLGEQLELDQDMEPAITIRGRRRSGGVPPGRKT